MINSDQLIFASMKTDTAPRKLLFVIYSMSAGGAERVMSYLVNHYARQNEVYLLTLARAEPFFEIDKRVIQISLNFQRPTSLLMFWKKISRVFELRRKILEINPDKIVSFLTQTNTLTLAATLFLSSEVIISERNNPMHSAKGLFTRLMRRLLYPLADYLVLQSEGVKRWYSSKAYSRLKMVTIENPVSVLGRKDPKTISYKDKYTVVLAGRLHLQKGIDLLIDGIRNSEFCRKSCLFEIYGDGPLREQLLSKILEYDLEDCVHLMGRTAKLSDKVLAADLFILPSRFEGLPNVLIEAMSLGVPSISFDCDFGPRDIIDSGENALLINNGDIEAFVQGIELLLNDLSLRIKFNMNSPKSMSKFGKEAIMKKWDKLIIHDQPF